jgi:D-serine dehydratase
LASAVSAPPEISAPACYEGLGVKGDDESDRALADGLMNRVQAIAQAIDSAGGFESDEMIVSAGGSAIFDLVARHMRPALSRPVRGVLRSGCYVTHDHGHYRRLVHRVAQRCGCADELQPALEVWTQVQSVPEPGLALLTGGRRDVSFDIELPRPLTLARGGRLQTLAADGGWRIKALNDQHAHLCFDPDAAPQPQVGDLVALGISHPCTTFDKWHWLPLVDDDYRVIDAVTTHF